MADSPPLTFEDVKQLVEAASPAISLQLDAPPAADPSVTAVKRDSKGRYLVAARDLMPGEVILQEYPLFQGLWDGSQSRKACVEAFAALADDASQALPHALEDSLHPCSPIVDCLSGIILCRLESSQAETEAERARARLKLQKLLALTTAGSLGVLPDSFPEELLSRLKPELRSLTSSEELRNMALVLLCNRFASEADAPLDLNFAGSMFEHSCSPNCFVSNRNWQRSSFTAEEKCYRTHRSVAKGEALSIDYLMLPDTYLPFKERSELLRQWGFSCSCDRCLQQVDITRAFVCPNCGESELCTLLEAPQGSLATEAGDGPTTDAPQKLQCQSCKTEPSAAYAESCLAAEQALKDIAAGKTASTVEGAEETVSKPSEPRLLAGSESDVMGCFHYLAFQAMWRVVVDGPKASGSLESYEEATHGLIQCIERLYDNAAHPQLLDLYHTMAQIYQDDVEEQQHWLGLEHQVLKTNYPEEALRQDDEVMALIQGRGPWNPDPAQFVGSGLETMD
mmetsp:Transcript_6926/g.12290  ORF Transcript_6926/g.12290 Transcript_6926/m.12290 type:complete len:510 (+) Transcript_6926:105-1634(+)